MATHSMLLRRDFKINIKWAYTKKTLGDIVLLNTRIQGQTRSGWRVFHSRTHFNQVVKKTLSVRSIKSTLITAL